MAESTAVTTDTNRFSEFKYDEKGMGWKTYGSTRDYVKCVYKHMPTLRNARFPNSSDVTMANAKSAAYNSYDLVVNNVGQRVEAFQDTGGKVVQIVDILTKTALVGTAVAATTGMSVLVGFFALPAVVGAVAAYKIGQYAYSFYSKRESQHRALNGFVWSGCDNERPSLITASNVKQIAGAAHYLMVNGENQMERAMDKLKHQTTRLDDEMALLAVQSNKIEQAVIACTRPTQYRDTQKNIFLAIKEGFKIIDQIKKPGGSLARMARRVQHLSNYLQAPMIVANSMAATLFGITEIKQLEDPFSDAGPAKDLRTATSAISMKLDQFYIRSLTLMEWFPYKAYGLEQLYAKRQGEFRVHENKFVYSTKVL
jgi:hypothetical protein